VESSELSDNIIIVAVSTSRYRGRIDCICMPCQRQCSGPGYAAMHQSVIQNGGMVIQPPSPVVHQAGVLKAPALSKSDSVSWFQLWNPPRLMITGHACPKATFLQPCVGIGRYPANQKKLEGRQSNLYFTPSTSAETSRRDIRPAKPHACGYHSQTVHFISMTFNPRGMGFAQGLVLTG
jgi:hypothetical protein